MVLALMQVHSRLRMIKLSYTSLDSQRMDTTRADNASCSKAAMVIVSESVSMGEGASLVALF